MDKLKPILVHKFWIILFIALLLPVIGWSMATGSLAKEIDERKSAIDKAFTDAQVAPNPPNETWSTALKEINKEKEKYIGQSHKYLWDKQKSLFVWPSNIAPLMKNTPYRGDISRVPRNLYRSAYKFEIMRAHKLANPFNLEDGTGTVDISLNTIPHVPINKWKTLPPTSEEMWDAQEDVWLVSSILKAIAEVNKSAANISEAPVRQITVLELRGGTVGDDGSAPAGDGGMSGMDGMGDMMGGGPGGFGGGPARAGAMGDGRGGTMQIDVDMDLTKIFGNDVDGSAGGGDDGMDGMSMDGPGMMGGGFGGGQGAQNLKRYYHDDEALPYKTRAFYLKAVIQSSKLPHLLAQLSSMPWPVEIVRVQRADLFDDDKNPIATLQGGGKGRRGGAGGMGAGGDFGTGGDFGAADFGNPAGGGSGFAEEAGGLPGMGQTPGLGNQGLRDAALSDPELAVVTIAGLMTLYKPYVPPEGDMMAETAGGNPPPGEPATDASATPADGTNATPAPAAGTEANPVEPANTPAPAAENQPAPAGDTPEQPTEPETPAAGSNADSPQPPPTEVKSEEPANQ
ncbi:hypothetical protein [Gimesia fumaroli]|jgi:hypothetical protein|uniref:Uncharacterized protein n=1 Tax=Gimesia fumaroli TaxID=2527976 RepID=A0A518ICP2_9PLAN|nr:hypothetical protein [Gimesia fumaroli]QDV50799.1 hypothetical protein Enr17x_28430 [Gimesia fumaroli]